MYRLTQESETQAKISEIQALVSSSEGLFSSNRRLDALIEAIKAKKRLQNLGAANTNIEHQVEDVLRQSVYGADEYNRFSGHTAAVLAVDVSPDGQTIATASLDKTIKLWNIDGTKQRTLRGHTASVWGVTFSPDGSFIASAGTENVVRLWQSKNPFQQSIIPHKAGIWSISITS